MSFEMIPFNDLSPIHEELREIFHGILDGALDRSDFIGGSAIAEFERDFAQACGVRHAVGLASGTDALYVALKVLGIGAGDLVVTVPNSFIATAEAISLCGATPLFVDVGRADFNMDPESLKDVLETHPERENIKAIIPVHLHGRSARMEAISVLAQAHGLPIVADGAQAHLAQCGDKSVAQWADFTTFSFYPGKNLGALGDAGALVTDDETFAMKAREFANHGRQKKYEHRIVGCNARMDTLQAAFLREKLKGLSELTRRRQALSQSYQERLQGIGDLSFAQLDPQHPSVVHLMVVLTEKRDELMAHLSKENIQTGIHYPLPLHLQPAYAHLVHGTGDFPVTEALAKTQLSLPLFPHMSEAQLQRVCASIKSFFGG